MDSGKMGGDKIYYNSTDTHYNKQEFEVLLTIVMVKLFLIFINKSEVLLMYSAPHSHVL